MKNKQKQFKIQEKRQVDALVALKDNREKSIKAIEGKSVDKNDQSQASKIFRDLIEKRKKNTD